MKLQEIREKASQNGYSKQTLRQAWLAWLSDASGNLHFDTALTVTPRKIFVKRVANKAGDGYKDIYRQLNRTELERANVRLVHMLNKLVYKESYRRFNKRMDVAAVIEGEKELIDLHTHLALKRPAELATNEFARRVLKALQLSGDFEIFNNGYDERKHSDDKKCSYKLEIVDSGWLSYITKKLNGRDFENLYLL
jgi:ribosomal protein L31E